MEIRLKLAKVKCKMASQTWSRDRERPM